MAAYQYTDGLESARLVSRLLTEDDYITWTLFFKDKDIAEFIPMGTHSNDEDRAGYWIGRQMERYANKRFGLQALLDKNNNCFIGQCGLLLQEIDGKEELEVGYHILKEHRGQDYAPEAAKMFIDYAFKHGLAESVISIIHVNNYKSQRVAEKNGLLREKQTSWNGLDVFIYRIHKAS